MGGLLNFVVKTSITALAMPKSKGASETNTLKAAAPGASSRRLAGALSARAFGRAAAGARSRPRRAALLCLAF